MEEAPGAHPSRSSLRGPLTRVPELLRCLSLDRACHDAGPLTPTHPRAVTCSAAWPWGAPTAVQPWRAPVGATGDTAGGNDSWAQGPGETERETERLEQGVQDILARKRTDNDLVRTMRDVRALAQPAGPFRPMSLAASPAGREAPPPAAVAAASADEDSDNGDDSEDGVAEIPRRDARGHHALDLRICTDR